jgi:hypothetical protein
MQSVSNGVEPETTPGGAPFLRQAALPLSCNLSQTGLQTLCVHANADMPVHAHAANAL